MQVMSTKLKLYHVRYKKKETLVSSPNKETAAQIGANELAGVPDVPIGDKIKVRRVKGVKDKKLLREFEKPLLSGTNRYESTMQA